MVVVYPLTYSPISALTYSRRAPVPIRYACPSLPPNYITDREDGWNCNLCGGAKKFYQPYVKGDVFPFQTQFTDNFNSLPTLTGGIFGASYPIDYLMKIELLDGEGNKVTDIVEMFCEWFWVGYSNATGSIQTWFVNTGLFPDDLKCWQLKITYYKLVDEAVEVDRIIYTEQYKEVDECQKTTKIESTYNSTECNGNFYATLPNSIGVGTNMPFYNFIRVFGTPELVGESTETTENDRGTIISSKTSFNYIIKSGLVPAYFYLKVSQVVRGAAVFVNGEQYQNFDLSQRDDSVMIPLDITFSSVCRISNKACNF